jgi:cell division initiation protein
MIIAPLEIRQKTFLRGFRGYEKEEVDAFLNSLSQEWEKLIEMNKDLKRKLEQAENESQKLKAVESSLFRTLKTAEDASTSIIAQAEQNATQLIEHSESVSQSILNEAKLKSEEIIADAEMRSKSSLNNLDVKVASLKTEVKELESLKNKLVTELSKVAQNTLDRVTKITPKNTPLTEEVITEIEFTAPEITIEPEMEEEVKVEVKKAKEKELIPPMFSAIEEPKAQPKAVVAETVKTERKITQIAFVDNIDNDNEVSRKTTSVVEEDISFFDMIK